MNGKSIWSFEDTSRLRSPRGVVVDNQGFVFVAGEQSGNIVMISPDGNSELIGFGLHVEPSNSFQIATIIKFISTVTSSKTITIFVVNCLYYVLCVNINDTYTCTSRNSYRICIDTGYVVE
jgi:hypothetical protein